MNYVVIGRNYGGYSPGDSAEFNDLTINGSVVFTDTTPTMVIPEAGTFYLSDYPPDPTNAYQTLKIIGGTGGAIEMSSYDGVIRFHDTNISAPSITNGGYPVHYSTVTQDVTIRPIGDVNVFTVNGAGSLNLRGWSETKIGAGSSFVGGYLLFPQAGVDATLDTLNLNIDGGVLKIAGTEVLNGQMPYDAAPTATSIRDALIAIGLMAAS